MPPGTLDSGLLRYAILLRLQVQGRRSWRARLAACASPLPLTVAERTTHTHINAVNYPEFRNATFIRAMAAVSVISKHRHSPPT
jgi:hypothetical protein